MATDSLFKSNLDDTCNGTMYEGIGCSAGITNARGAGTTNVRPYGSHTRNQSHIRNIQMETNGLDERLGQKELTTETTSTEISTEPTKKYKTMATPIVQTSKLMTPKPSLSTD